MRLWITRPEQDAGVLRARLVAQGHEVVIESLLHIDFEDADPIELDDVQALIATSRNGVRAAAASDNADLARHLPLFAVGPGTASTAEALGFVHVVQGPSTAEHLVPTIVERTDVNAGTLLHLAGGSSGLRDRGRAARVRLSCAATHGIYSANRPAAVREALATHCRWRS